MWISMAKRCHGNMNSSSWESGCACTPRGAQAPLLTKRVQEAQTALKKSRSLPLEFDGRASIAAVMIIAAALYGVELADISKKTAAALESTVMYALWGPSRPCRSKETVFALLLPGHRVAPTMVIPYRRMYSLARQPRTTSTPQTIIQAIWEAVPSPKVTGPLRGALQGFRKLGWQPLMATCRGEEPSLHPLSGAGAHLVRCGGSSAGTPPSVSKQAARRPMQVSSLIWHPSHPNTHTHTQRAEREERPHWVEVRNIVVVRTELLRGGVLWRTLLLWLK